VKGLHNAQAELWGALRDSNRMSLGDHAFGRCGASPAGALHKVGLFLLFVGAGSGFESQTRDT
jgi:hypothetical protein